MEKLSLFPNKVLSLLTVSHGAGKYFAHYRQRKVITYITKLQTLWPPTKTSLHTKLVQQWHKYYVSYQVATSIEFKALCKMDPIPDTVKVTQNLRLDKSQSLGETLLLLYC